MATIDELRLSRKNPSVLKLKVLKILGQHPDIFIFIFEGPDDVPVYEEWLKRIDSCPKYEPLPGAGKQQLLAYYDLLIKDSNPLLEKIFFFVDRDFDLPIEKCKNIFELSSYSIENLLCAEEVLESVLRDEFKKAGEPSERTVACEKFREALDQFAEYCTPVDFILFVAQRKSISVIKKPEKITQIASISMDLIHVAYENLDEVILIDGRVEEGDLAQLRMEFDSLPRVLRQRGKYQLDMFRRWVRLLAEDIRSERPIIFAERNERLAGDPSSASLRRLAASTTTPTGLAEFIDRLARNEVVESASS
ncbi:DUF4435 domain-containing protein [Burkholderia gladioli]|uniref:DUF4435 domain-containing protein n=1 Tax=Burkholderia gladioli TaxID=28095 RepID=UPI000BBD306F|nr:DUF4435 domain-containing protein [Burkholderia gladioli]ATF84424.1 hypothetical protein CO712_04730 [Burkholderia gladioli pv. gladioli]